MAKLAERIVRMKNAAVAMALSGALALGLCPAGALAAESLDLAAGAMPLAVQIGGENPAIETDWVYYSSTTPYKPNIIVTYFDEDYISTKLEEGVGYSVSYSYRAGSSDSWADVSGITKAGEYRVAVTCIAPLVGSHEVYIDVYDSNDIAAAVSTSEAWRFFSSSSPYKPSVGIAMRSAVYGKYGSSLKEGVDYTVQYTYRNHDSRRDVVVEGLSKAGDYYLKFTGKGAYKGSKKIYVGVGDIKATGNTARKYTGKAIKPTLGLVWDDGIDEEELEADDYTLFYKNNVNAGTAKVVVKGKGIYAGKNVVTFKIAKAANPMTAKGKTATVKFKKLKKKAQKLAAKKAIAVSKAKGKVTYKKVKGNKKIAIAKKTGKVTVKKGLAKGAYEVRAKVTAAGNANYAKVTKTVTFKVKVK